jgi:hypothetical protein
MGFRSKGVTVARGGLSNVKRLSSAGSMIPSTARAAMVWLTAAIRSGSSVRSREGSSEQRVAQTASNACSTAATTAGWNRPEGELSELIRLLDLTLFQWRVCHRG